MSTNWAHVLIWKGSLAEPDPPSNAMGRTTPVVATTGVAETEAAPLTATMKPTAIRPLTEVLTFRKANIGLR